MCKNAHRPQNNSPWQVTEFHVPCCCRLQEVWLKVEASVGEKLLGHIGHFDLCYLAPHRSFWCNIGHNMSFVILVIGNWLFPHKMFYLSPTLPTNCNTKLDIWKTWDIDSLSNVLWQDKKKKLYSSRTCTEWPPFKMFGKAICMNSMMQAWPPPYQSISYQEQPLSPLVSEWVSGWVTHSLTHSVG